MSIPCHASRAAARHFATPSTLRRTTAFKPQNWISVRRHATAVSGDVLPNEAAGALRGLKILDVTRVLSGPFCTQILADYGAEVIKIEETGKGDETRHWLMAGEEKQWKSDVGPISNYFCAINRNKRSITLNLKSTEAKEIFFELLKTSDVLVENYKPGTMDRLGLGYEVLAKVNPRLIYASISGYGPTGPYGNRGGYDPIAAAEAGLLHVTGERNGPPVRPGIGMIDMATGLYLHGAIMAALIARQRTGLGQRVDASLFETQISLLTNVGMSWLNRGIEAERWGLQHPSIAPYNAYKTRDLHLVCGATNDAQFEKFCKLLGRDGLLGDERFATNRKRVDHREYLNTIFDEIFLTKTTDEWLKIFDGSGLAYAPINNMERTFAHPQTKARDMVQELDTDLSTEGQVKVIGPAVKFSSTKTSYRSSPPALGQHTRDVLAEIGIDGEKLDDLKSKKII
ncbi:hypothetical protein CERZMDRAFT_46322 [Cercospora zeae-maydis SCOH1-5]|uniref:Uncharacterized protein n=1 Tax=Cercospora zeae-maydis SCOH1-5 TaxID=717836 RepID=A0A6A6F8W3_9PEZI|nr:hypothetical protein CERZMDRAFT_46322 [Cercospora zeae-maydis SCOH1-5]